MQTIKCVVVGDGAVGKTCLLISYTTNKFPSEYVPTVSLLKALFWNPRGKIIWQSIDHLESGSPAGVWQLRSHCYDRRGTLHPGTLRHGGPRRLRPVETTILPSDRRLPRLFFSSFAVVIWERQGKGIKYAPAVVLPKIYSTKSIETWTIHPRRWRIDIGCVFLPLQWVPEIAHHCQRTPFLLVGTQIDLRDDQITLEKLAKNKQRPVTLETGEKQAKELRAVKYVECSALTQVQPLCHEALSQVLLTFVQEYWQQPFIAMFVLQKGLKNVFDEAILAALEPPEPTKKNKCVILWKRGQVSGGAWPELYPRICGKTVRRRRLTGNACNRRRFRGWRWPASYPTVGSQAERAKKGSSNFLKSKTG